MVAIYKIDIAKFVPEILLNLPDSFRNMNKDLRQKYLCSNKISANQNKSKQISPAKWTENISGGGVKFTTTK